MSATKINDTLDIRMLMTIKGYRSPNHILICMKPVT